MITLLYVHLKGWRVNLFHCIITLLLVMTTKMNNDRCNFKTVRRNQSKNLNGEKKINNIRQNYDFTKHFSNKTFELP